MLSCDVRTSRQGKTTPKIHFELLRALQKKLGTGKTLTGPIIQLNISIYVIVEWPLMEKDALCNIHQTAVLTN